MPVGEHEYLVFDLDGTLIDSAPSILGCFRRALDEAGMAPRVPLDDRLIGPPLAQTLRTLTGVEDEGAIASLADAFKRHYDTTGYRETLPYAGVAEALAELKAAGHRLALATNKRILPTRAILGHLGWDGLFASVWALDSVEPRLADKTAMLGALLADAGVPPGQAAYVGDKAEDGLAADANGMAFVAACWGYGDFADAPGHWRRLDAPAGLPDMFPVRESAS